MSYVDFLRRLPLFSDLSDPHLERLCGMVESATVPAGNYLMREGDPSGSVYIIEDGQFEITKRSGQQEVTLAFRGPGEVLGEMSLLDRTPRSASVRAVRDSRVLGLSSDAFERLLSESTTAVLEILRTMSIRLRENRLMLQQSEKMAALGTLTAGMMHELNNPAAATSRSAEQLGDALWNWQQRAASLTALGLTGDQLQVVNRLRAEMVQRAESPSELDPLTRSDQEYELETWLDGLGAEQAWEVAPVLVNFGWNAKALQATLDGFTPDQQPVVAYWLAAGCGVYALLGEVRMGAERISEIVRSVKEYSFKDQAPIQDVDVHRGLENTLVILKHELKSNEVTEKREFAQDLPRIEAYGSELNQVWTNIIANAIDAMKGRTRRELTLRTYATNGKVVVEIGDTGSGISPDVKERIFEPFFTTKEPGKGTGLGLHISYNIVQKHGGSIDVTSEPGDTRFRVTLPVHLSRGNR